MAKKKTNISKKATKKVEEPTMPYERGEIKIFNSFEEQEEYQLQQMARLSSIEILTHLRQMINLAYGMHGYNPDKLPIKHSIKIIKKSNEHF